MRDGMGAKVYVKINGREGVHAATVVGERRGGFRLLDVDGGEPLVEGRDCEVVPEPESPLVGTINARSVTVIEGPVGTLNMDDM